MNLPINYYWIQGFEHKYALEWSPEIDSFKTNVFSFIYPGYYGKPKALTPKARDPVLKYALTVSYFKDTYPFSRLVDLTKSTKAFKIAMAVKQVVAERSDTPTSTTLADSNSNGCWMIAKFSGDVMQFSDNPKQHPTQASAYIEAERLAMANAGTKYVVVKTVRMVVAGGITAVDY